MKKSLKKRESKEKNSKEWKVKGLVTLFRQAYMEDHLKNKDRLLKEWEALCSYQAEPSSVSVAQSESNLEKNRYPDFVPCKTTFCCYSFSLYHHFLEKCFIIMLRLTLYVCVSDDHSRVKLKPEINPSREDYINASIIVRTPSDFWNVTQINFLEKRQQWYYFPFFHVGS